jgi:hypothetical protein
VVIDRDGMEFHDRDALVGIIRVAGLPLFQEAAYTRLDV